MNNYYNYIDLLRAKCNFNNINVFFPFMEKLFELSFSLYYIYMRLLHSTYQDWVCNLEHHITLYCRIYSICLVMMIPLMFLCAVKNYSSNDLSH